MKTSTQHILGSVLLLAGAVVSGCKVGPNYHAPATSMPASFMEMPATRPAATQFTQDADTEVRWWQRLSDAKLTSLVERAIAANPSITVAQARCRRLGRRESAQALLYPEVHANASFFRFRGSSGALGLPDGVPSMQGNLYQVGFDAMWEVDVFGGTRRQIESARASEDAVRAMRRGVVLMVASETARGYVELRGYQHELAVARVTLVRQQQTLAITQDKHHNGLASDLDVLRARTEVEATEAQIPPLEQAIRQYIQLLSVLVAAEPAGLSKELTPAARIPAIPDRIFVGGPSDLLRRRPDIQASERELASATAQVGVAVSKLFPRVAIGGAAGIADRTSNNLDLNSSGYYATGPSIDWTVFDGGRRQAGIQASKAEVEAAKASYEDTVRRAFAEAESALVAVDRETARRDSLKQLCTTTNDAVVIAQWDYQRGILDNLAVLDAERQADRADMLLAQSEVTLTVNVVTLYKILGGGWEVAESSPTTQPNFLRKDTKP